ncbi:MAG: PaaI family thioesterase [Frankiales bacterium]|nr:PaaI family thioesterase [Frankiales bacterium]
MTAVDNRLSWDSSTQEVPPGDEHARLVAETRRYQDLLTGASAPVEVLAAAADHVAAAAAALAAHQVPEREQVTGHRHDVPGRGQTMSPVVYVDEAVGTSVRGRVTFGRFYLGGNGAAHGGSIPLFFDEVLGRLANTTGPRSRTAYLHTDYRSITPIGRELSFAAQLDREDGRKRWFRCRLLDCEVLCAEAEGLFVALRPGQP